VLNGIASACLATGFPQMHAHIVLQLACDLHYAILFRDVKGCTGLLEEGYACKGFRIDTKSCNWGPMQGFVCVDSRLSKKGMVGAADNAKYTLEAVTGAVRHDALGDLPDLRPDLDKVPEWTSGVLPLVISNKRWAKISVESGLQARLDMKHLVGTSVLGNIVFPWRLIPIETCMKVPAYQKAVGIAPPEGGYGIFVDNGRSFRQFIPPEISGQQIKVGGYDALLGLTNPGTEHFGYRACVTGDYDLFGVWPPGDASTQGAHNKMADQIVTAGSGGRVGAKPPAAWDQRYVEQFAGEARMQHYLTGNSTRRINLIKVLLNSSLQVADQLRCGALVHHSDEVGNPSKLSKNLQECFPLIAFLPGKKGKKGEKDEAGRVMALENEDDFTAFLGLCHKRDIVPDLRPEWNRFLA
jgi:hypothetical protein